MTKYLFFLKKILRNQLLIISKFKFLIFTIKLLFDSGNKLLPKFAYSLWDIFRLNILTYTDRIREIRKWWVA